MKPFSSIQTNDWQLQKIQDNVSDALDPIAKLPLLDGRFIRDVTLYAGQDNNVPTGLSRPYLMWFVCNQKGPSVIYQAASSQPQLFVNLWCTVDVTLSLWVA